MDRLSSQPLLLMCVLVYESLQHKPSSFAKACLQGQSTLTRMYSRLPPISSGSISLCWMLSDPMNRTRAAFRLRYSSARDRTDTSLGELMRSSNT
eukprot:1143324-Pelagomonas_calceolata.AAC.7